MPIKKKIYLLSLALLILAACGEKSGPTISVKTSYGSTNPFTLTNLNDVVVYVASIEVSGLPFLDGYGGTAADNVPDTIVFPRACASTTSPLAADCGYSAAEAQSALELKGVPLGYYYSIRLVGRDKSTNQIFSGQTASNFQFSETTTTIPTINITID